MPKRTLTLFFIVLLLLYFTSAGSFGQKDILSKLNSQFNKIAEKVTPSVVYIHAVKKGFASYFIKKKKEKNFSYDRTDPHQNMEMFGSGVIVSDDGYILTNNHVIAGADRIEIILYNDERYQAEVVGKDPSSDLAVLKLNAPVDKFEAAKLGNSDELAVGEIVIAIGSPFGLRNTITQGIVSAKGRKRELQMFIQTDAAINKGNSGGALVNIDGKVIGINTAIMTQNINPVYAGFQGIGLAIPINYAKRIMNMLIKHKRIIRSFLGIVPGNEDHQSSIMLHIDNGVIVSNVIANSPADKSEIRPWDIIIEFDNQKVRDYDQLNTLVLNSEPETEISIKVKRDGKTIEKKVKLTEKKDEIPIIYSEEKDKKNIKINVDDITFGLSLKPLSMEQMKVWSLSHGLWVRRVDVDSLGEKAGIEPGDIVLEIEGKRLASVKDFISYTGANTDKSFFRLRLIKNKSGKIIFTTVEKDYGPK